MFLFLHGLAFMWSLFAGFPGSSELSVHFAGGGIAGPADGGGSMPGDSGGGSLGSGTTGGGG